MKYYDISTTLFIVGCLCLMVISSSKGQSIAASDPTVTTAPLEDNYNSTAYSSNHINDSLSSGEDVTSHGTKSKVKNIVNKVKNKLKEGQGGHWRHRYRHKRVSNGSSNYDTSTVLWIVFGTIGGSLLIIAVYYGFKAYSKSERQPKA